MTGLAGTEFRAYLVSDALESGQSGRENQSRRAVAFLQNERLADQVARWAALVGLVFQDQEVRHPRREVYRHRRGDRPERVVRGHGHVMGLCHRRDFLGLEETAGFRQGRSTRPVGGR